MSAQTASALQLDSIRSLLSALAATDLGAAAVRRLEPLDTIALDHQRSMLDELGQVWEEGGALIPSQEVGFQRALRRLVEGRGIGTDDLLALAVLLEIFGSIVEHLRSSTTPTLYELMVTVIASRDADADESRIEFARQLAQRVRSVLDSKGNVRNDASPTLARLVSSVRSTRDALYSHFESYARDHAGALSDDAVMRTEGRLALLLPAGSRGRMDGIIHGRSGTEKSYYFEPLELVEENNKLQEQQAQEEAERERLLIELASVFEDNAQLIEGVGEFMERIDALQAAHRFGLDLNGQHPELLESNATWSVHGARHPLLDPRLKGLRELMLGNAGHRGDVVPLEINAKDDRILVITGPNAGGKTVALKTLGVLSYLAACGWPIPLDARPQTRLPWFDRWIAVVGDEQDVMAEQSTFSARLHRLREVWDSATQGTLVLLDEVGSGTNPEEGAALSIALVEHLVERGCFAVVTTHLLQVANAALALPGCASLAMELDAETGAPTYKIRGGAPGSSHALDLARRLGLAPEWLARAEELLGEDQMTLRHLIAETEQSRQRAAEIEEQLAALAQNQETLQRRQEEELSLARSERLAARKKASSELEQFRRTARDQLTNELKRARSKGAAAASVRTAQKEAARRAAQLTEGSGLASSLAEEQEPTGHDSHTSHSAGKPNHELVAGDPVRHRALGWSGTIDRLVPARGKSSKSGGASKVDVSVRGKRMRCALSELEFDSSKATNSKAKHRPAAKPTVTINTQSTADTGMELMLVGERVAPALDRLDAFIERSIVGNLDQVRVVHGQGSGRLKEAVRTHLHGHPLVAKVVSAPRAMGGDGATVVHFRTE